MELEKLLGQLSGRDKSDFPNEEATKMGLIIPVLQALGWDTSNPAEVVPEKPSMGLTVDYCLTTKSSQEILVEAKAAGESLTKHEKQLLNYAFQEGVPLAILTNGFEWWFYLPMQEGPVQKRCIARLEIGAPGTANTIRCLLERSKVELGQYLVEAKRMLVFRALALTWDGILQSPPTELLELLAARTVADKELKTAPSVELVREFLALLQTGPSDDLVSVLTKDARFFNYRTPTSLVFRGKSIPVLYWNELYRIFLSEVHAWDANRAEQLLDFIPTPNFVLPITSKSAETYSNAFSVAGTPYFALERSGGPEVVRVLKEVVKKLGLGADDVLIKLAAPKEK